MNCFNELDSQPRVVESILQKHEKGKMPHSMLFCGPPTPDKRGAVFALSKLLMCSDEGCGHCRICEMIQRQEHPDLYMVECEEKKASISIAQIQDLAKKVVMRGTESSVKVAVIDDAGSMTVHAQNALLKILEEPPANMYFILITSKEGALSLTIKSRCQALRFTPASDSRLVQSFAEEAGISFSDASYALLFTSGDLEEAKKIDPESSRELCETFFHLAAKDRGDTLALPEWSRERTQLLFGLDLLARFYRDAVVLKLSGSVEQLEFEDRADEISDLASRHSIDELNDWVDAIGKAREDIGNSLNIKLVMNQLMMKIGFKIA